MSLIEALSPTHFWISFVFFPALLLLLAWLGGRRRRVGTVATGTPSVVGCGNCDYDVRGLPGDICPECGSDLRQIGYVVPQSAAWQKVPSALRAVVWIAAVVLLGALFVPRAARDFPLRALERVAARSYDHIQSENQMSVRIERIVASLTWTLDTEAERADDPTWSQVTPHTVSVYAQNAPRPEQDAKFNWAEFHSAELTIDHERDTWICRSVAGMTVGSDIEGNPTLTPITQGLGKTGSSLGPEAIETLADGLGVPADAQLRENLAVLLSPLLPDNPAAVEAIDSVASQARFRRNESQGGSYLSDVTSKWMPSAAVNAFWTIVGLAGLPLVLQQVRVRVPVESRSDGASGRAGGASARL